MESDTSNEARIDMYRDAFNVFLQKPIFGGGLEQYSLWTGTGRIAHSTYAEAIADFGLIGSIIYFIPYLYTVYRAFAIQNRVDEQYKCRMVLVLCMVELFLGIVQIWFMEVTHFYCWTIIFLIVQGYSSKETTEINKRESKYVRA